MIGEFAEKIWSKATTVFFRAHAMQHAPLHARVKKKHCQKHSMEYKICPRSIKFVRGAMGQNRLNGANIYHVL